MIKCKQFKSRDNHLNSQWFFDKKYSTSKIANQISENPYKNIKQFHKT